MRILMFILASGLVLTPPLTATVFPILTTQRIQSLKKEPCVFMHAWAIWCEPCLIELPSLLNLLDKMKDSVKPVIVDLSAALAHEKLSTKWLAPHKPSFTLFRKPAIDDRRYLHSMDATAPDSLPFSVLYRRGKKVKSWSATMDLRQLESDLSNICKK